ncbi:MAG: HNH endonuclease, partial [Candidatus Promineifilaceae bacterium]
MLSTNEIRTVSERAQHRCEYCKSPADFATGSFELEHIEPKAKGGTDQLNNIALACNGCNRHKYTCTKALDPVSL